MQPLPLYAPPNGTTTGPATPGPPLWMCAAVSVVTFDALISQQTDLPLIFTSAVPEPSGSPLGVSALPVSTACREFPPLWLAPAAAVTAINATTAARAMDLNVMGFLLVSAGDSRRSSSPTPRDRIGRCAATRPSASVRPLAAVEALRVELGPSLGAARQELHTRRADLDRSAARVVQAEQVGERARLLVRLARAQAEVRDREIAAVGQQLLDPRSRRVDLEPVARPRRDERPPAAAV